jgi:hypothetical protein
MGLRRLRGRLDQMQGEANETMGLAQDLIADLSDGFGVTVSVDPAKFWDCWAKLRSGEKFDLPITVQIDPTVDT